mmetsp:Transcript_12076/g.36669  ORF Transcript_12076/g.36669 Transcript_12076/m.36669 type:complete len:224 (-) Transcript_12076:345-1016(-)
MTCSLGTWDAGGLFARSSAVTSSPSPAWPDWKSASLGSEPSTPTTSITSFSLIPSKPNRSWLWLWPALPPTASYSFTRQGESPWLWFTRAPASRSPPGLRQQPAAELVALPEQQGGLLCPSASVLLFTVWGSSQSIIAAAWGPSSSAGLFLEGSPPGAAGASLAGSPSRGLVCLPRTQSLSPATETQNRGFLSQTTVSLAAPRSSSAKSSYLVVRHSPVCALW